MAREIQIQPGSVEKTARIRHPVAVVAWSFVTLGIYFFYWWYQINRELRDLGQARGMEGLGEKPVRSLLAVFPGWLIIVPPFVSFYNGIKRVQRAQDAVTHEVTMNGWIVLILILISFVPFLGVITIILPGYFQGELNKVWEKSIAMETKGGFEPNPLAPEPPAPA